MLLSINVPFRRLFLQLFYIHSTPCGSGEEHADWVALVLTYFPTASCTETRCVFTVRKNKHTAINIIYCFVKGLHLFLYYGTLGSSLHLRRRSWTNCGLL